MSAEPSKCVFSGCEEDSAFGSQHCDAHASRPRTRSQTKQKDQDGSSRTQSKRQSVGKVKKQVPNRLTPSAALAADAMTKASKEEFEAKMKEAEVKIEEAKRDAEAARLEVIEIREAKRRLENGDNDEKLYKSLLGKLYTQNRSQKEIIKALNNTLENRDNQLRQTVDTLAQLERQLADLRSQGPERMQREFTQEEQQSLLDASTEYEDLDLSTEDYLAMISSKINELKMSES